jgi:hypothetical protein
MLEFLQYLERIAPRLEPALLIMPGLFCVLVGLFVWLAGLRYAKLIAASIGVLAGGICGLFLIGRKLMPDIFLAVFAGFIAMFLHKFVFVFLAALIAFAGVTFLLADVHIEKHSELILYINGSGTATISTSEAAVILSRAIDYLMERMKALYARFSLLHWSAAVGGGLLAAVLTVYFGSVAGALCCATLGTSLNFAGMVLLLLYKGAEPVSRIGHRNLFFAVVFAVMIGIGTFVQLIFCLPRRRKSIQGPKSEPQQDSGGSYATKMRWLNQ